MSNVLINQFVKRAHAQQWLLSVLDQDDMEFYPAKDTATALDRIYEADEANVEVHDKHGKRLGQVFFVHNNGCELGEDVADWSMIRDEPRLNDFLETLLDEYGERER